MTWTIYGVYTSGEKLIATFRNHLDAVNYALQHGLRVVPMQDDDTKWLVK